MSPTFNNLAPGSYSVTTRDSDLCSYVVDFAIILPTGLCLSLFIPLHPLSALIFFSPSFAFSYMFNAAVNVTVNSSPQTCYGSQTGSVSFLGSGGRGGYQYKVLIHYWNIVIKNINLIHSLMVLQAIRPHILH